MDPIGLPIASSVAGLNQAERSTVRDQKRPGETARDRFARALDEAELRVTEVEAPEAPRAVKGNDQEEAHEDRQEHAYYRPDGQARPDDTPPPRLDVEV